MRPLDMYRRSAIAIVILACVGALGACGSPAQGEIDRGKELLGADKREEAFVAFDAAVRLAPDNAVALAGRGCSRPYWVRGLIRAERGDDAEARADLLRAIDLAPSAGAADEILSIMAEYGLD